MDLPGVGHKRRVQAKLQALSQLHTTKQETQSISWYFLLALFSKLVNLCHIYCKYLILYSDFCGEGIVCVPFLVEGEAQLIHFVLGLQVAS